MQKNHRASTARAATSIDELARALHLVRRNGKPAPRADIELWANVAAGLAGRLNNFPLGAIRFYDLARFVVLAGGDRSTAQGAKIAWRRFSRETGLGSNIADAGFSEAFISAALEAASCEA